MCIVGILHWCQASTSPFPAGKLPCCLGWIDVDIPVCWWWTYGHQCNPTPCPWWVRDEKLSQAHVHQATNSHLFLNRMMCRWVLESCCHVAAMKEANVWRVYMPERAGPKTQGLAARRPHCHRALLFQKPVIDSLCFTQFNYFLILSKQSIWYN